jgi:hypothetical protein
MPRVITSPVRPVQLLDRSDPAGFYRSKTTFQTGKNRQKITDMLGRLRLVKTRDIKKHPFSYFFLVFLLIFKKRYDTILAYICKFSQR